VLTVNEAAARLGVSKSLVYALVERRMIPHFRVGLPGRRGKILFREEDLDAYLAGLKVEGGAAQAPSGRPLKHIRY
jgi:excisionase family DNA binding protein